MNDSIRIILRRIFPPLFSLRISRSEVKIVQGTLTSAFLRDCSEIARKNAISSGWIWGHVTSRRLRLEFSNDISERDRQRFRNAAGMHDVGKGVSG